MARLIVEQAGPLTTIQDAGRRGYMRFGVPRSGPVDRLAFAAAHAAAGNDGGALIEVSLGGATLRCVDGEVAFALAGGDFAADVDGTGLGGWTTGVLRAGQRLRVRQGDVGNWAYLAFGGRLQAAAWLGSVATHALSGLGGGRLAVGAALVVEAVHEGAAGAIPRPPRLVLDGPARVVPGPQQRFFEPDAVAALAAGAYSAAAAFDRMGLVLDGPALVPTSLDMPSEPTVMGALQANGRGQLTVLLADHQTTGGYPRIGAVITPDIGPLAQLRVGAPVRFVVIDQAAAVAAARADAAAVTAYLASIGRGESVAERLARANLIDGMVDAVAD